MAGAGSSCSAVVVCLLALIHFSEAQFTRPQLLVLNAFSPPKTFHGKKERARITRLAGARRGGAGKWLSEVGGNGRPGMRRGVALRMQRREQIGSGHDAFEVAAGGSDEQKRLALLVGAEQA